MINKTNFISLNMPQYIGPNTIAGKVFDIDSEKEEKHYIVHLYDQTKRVLIKNFFTTGNNFRISNIDFKKGPFFIISHHPEKKYNAVIADNIGRHSDVDN